MDNSDDPTAQKLRRLQRRQLRQHRIDPSRPLRGIKRAQAFIREQRIVVASAQASLPVLTEAIAGAHLKGSWWSSAAPGTYRTLRGVVAAGIIAVPLVLGKETLLDPSLGPSLERVASDDKRRAESRRRLPDLGRRLLAAVESRDRVRMDQWDVETRRARPARLLLEQELLVWSQDMHTESGYHTAVVEPWATSEVSRRFARSSAKLDYTQARDELAMSALAAAVVAAEREARRWFCFGAGWLDEAIEAGRIERLTVGRTAWLACR